MFLQVWGKNPWTIYFFTTLKIQFQLFTFEFSEQCLEEIQFLRTSFTLGDSTLPCRQFLTARTQPGSTISVSTHPRRSADLSSSPSPAFSTLTCLASPVHVQGHQNRCISNAATVSSSSYSPSSNRPKTALSFRFLLENRGMVRKQQSHRSTERTFSSSSVVRGVVNPDKTKQTAFSMLDISIWSASSAPLTSINAQKSFHAVFPACAVEENKWMKMNQTKIIFFPFVIPSYKLLLQWTLFKLYGGSLDPFTSLIVFSLHEPLEHYHEFWIHYTTVLLFRVFA